MNVVNGSGYILESNLDSFPTLVKSLKIGIFFTKKPKSKTNGIFITKYSQIF